MRSVDLRIRIRSGFNFTQGDFAGWAAETGFREVRFEPLVGPSVAIAVK